MTETVDLRALIRLIPPARALKDDLDASLHLELYAGTGDLAVKSYSGLHASVTRFTDDPYVKSLALEISEEASDKEKVSLVRFASGQLVAYLEGQTGLIGGGSSSGNSYYTAPFVNSPMSNVGTETIKAMIRMVKDPPTEEEETEQEKSVEA